MEEGEVRERKEDVGKGEDKRLASEERGFKIRVHLGDIECKAEYCPARVRIGSRRVRKSPSAILNTKRDANRLGRRRKIGE